MNCGSSQTHLFASFAIVGEEKMYSKCEPSLIPKSQDNQTLFLSLKAYS